MGMQFTGDRGILAEFIVTTPADVATMKVEVGLTDDDQADAGAVNVKATPSVRAADLAVFCFDRDDNTEWGCFSAKAGTIVATDDLETVAASTTIV